MTQVEVNEDNLEIKPAAVCTGHYGGQHPRRIPWPSSSLPRKQGHREVRVGRDGLTGDTEPQALYNLGRLTGTHKCKRAGEQKVQMQPEAGDSEDRGQGGVLEEGP